MPRTLEQVSDRMWAALERELTPPRVRPIRVLLCTDGSESAAAAQRLLGSLPVPSGSSVRSLSVVSPSWRAPDWAVEEWTLTLAERAAARLRWPGVTVSAASSEGAVACEILREAERFDADLVILGSRGLTGVEAFLLGSVARNVAHHAPMPVLVAREPATALRRIVLALDESEHSLQAAEFLACFPLPEGAEVTVCHVTRPYPGFTTMAADTSLAYAAMPDEVWQEVRVHARELVETEASRLRAAGVTAHTAVREGDPANEILALARMTEADLVVAGARGVSVIQGLLVGSVADRILKGAPCSVLLVR
jgi:nucleotide-binding universal stress UspA family protein